MVIDNVVQEPDVVVIHENSSSQPRIYSLRVQLLRQISIYAVHRGIGSTSMKPPQVQLVQEQLATNLKSFTTDVNTRWFDNCIHSIRNPTVANSVMVFIDGILRVQLTSVSGNTLTFTSTPDASAEIEVKHTVLW